jgi:hypothetical protein
MELADTEVAFLFQVARLAALIRDVRHCPFSHTFYAFAPEEAQVRSMSEHSIILHRRMCCPRDRCIAAPGGRRLPRGRHLHCRHSRTPTRAPATPRPSCDRLTFWAKQSVRPPVAEAPSRPGDGIRPLFQFGLATPARSVTEACSLGSHQPARIVFADSSAFLTAEPVLHRQGVFSQHTI